MFKTIASNTFAQLVAKFFGAGLTLLTTYFTIRLAGLDLYGDLTKILILVAVGFTAIDFGLNAEGLRSAKSPAQMQHNLSHILLARFVLSLLAIIVLNLIIIRLPGGYSPQVKSIFWLGSLAIMFQGIYTSTNAWFQYNLSYWKSTISVVIGSLLATILTLYFLSHSPTIPNLVFANTAGYLAMAISSLLLLPRSQFENLRIYDLKFVLPLLRRSLTLGLILIASVLASKFDTVVLGVFRASSEVGQYGFAYRIFDVILVLPVFAMNSIYPIFLQSSKTNPQSSLISRTAWSMAGIGVVVAVILWFIAPLVSLVKPGLTISIEVLKILSFALPFFYVTAPLMWGLIAGGRDKVVLGIYVLAALFNVGLNLVFVPGFGAPAAAVNTGLTELFIFLALLYFSNNKFENQRII